MLNVVGHGATSAVEQDASATEKTGPSPPMYDGLRATGSNIGGCCPLPLAVAALLRPLDCQERIPTIGIRTPVSSGDRIDLRYEHSNAYNGAP